MLAYLRSQALYRDIARLLFLLLLGALTVRVAEYIPVNERLTDERVTARVISLQAEMLAAQHETNRALTHLVELIEAHSTGPLFSAAATGEVTCSADGGTQLELLMEDGDPATFFVVSNFNSEKVRVYRDGENADAGYPLCNDSTTCARDLAVRMKADAWKCRPPSGTVTVNLAGGK